MIVANLISQAALPLVLVVLSLLLFKNSSYFDSFVMGAKGGLEACTNLLPSMCLIMCAVKMLFASGAVDILINFLQPLFVFFHIPTQLLPAIVLRPFSGSAVTSLADVLFCAEGADSHAAKIASVLMGSTDTIIYTLSVYFSAAKIKKTRYAFALSFLVFVFSIFVSILMTDLLVK